LKKSITIKIFIFFGKKYLGTFSVDNISTMLKNLVPKSSNFFECELCDYKTSRKSQYERHIATDKHQKLQKSTICQQTSIFDNNESSGLICDCGKSYKERTGLWRHK
jgi:hypothetical protein